MMDKDFPLTSQRPNEFSKWEGHKNLKQVAGSKFCLPHFSARECHRFGLFIIHSAESNKFYFLPRGFSIFALRANGSVTGNGPQEECEKDPSKSILSSPSLLSPPLPSLLLSSLLVSSPLSLLRPRRHCTSLDYSLSLRNSEPGVWGVRVMKNHKWLLGRVWGEAPQHLTGRGYWEWWRDTTKASS